MAADSKLDSHAGATLKNEEWLTRWEKGHSYWTIASVHPMLAKYYDRLFSNKTIKLKFFIPLCGESIDLKWLYEEGHEVVGVELSELAVHSFFDKYYKGEYDQRTLDGVEGKLFATRDGRLRIYQMDFFKFGPTLERGFTAMFDRGSYEAINFVDHKRYCDILAAVCAPGSRSLLEVFHYDPAVFNGPPHTIPPELVQEDFGPAWRVELLEAVPADAASKFGMKIPGPLVTNGFQIHMHLLERTSTGAEL